MHDTTPGTAVVADRRPLERSFLRFLLEDEGLAVRAEAATMSDLLLALQREPPDTLVLHEHLARGHDDAVIAQVRWLAPEANIVVVTQGIGDTPPALLAIADATIVDGVGLVGLGPAVARPSRAPVPVANQPASTGSSLGDTSPPPPTSSRWVERLQGAVAASIVALAVIVLRGGGTAPNPTGDAEVLAAPSSDVGPLAPDRTSGVPAETDIGTGPGSATEFATALPDAAGSGSTILSAGDGTEEEPAVVQPEDPDPPPQTDPPPTPVEPDPAPTPSPSSGNARPNGAGGPPAEVTGRLKPMVQELQARLPPRTGGLPGRPQPGIGGGPPASNGPSKPQGGKGQGRPEAGPGAHPSGNAHGLAGGGPPPWAHGPRR